MKRLALLVMLLLFAIVPMRATCPTSAECPVHDAQMSPLLQVKYVNGHEFQLFRCPQGDEYWVRCD